MYVVKTVLQLVQYIYLLSVLGFANWGMINFGTQIILYFDILVEFGFTFPTMRQVSMNKEDKKFLSGIYNSVMFFKLVVTTACFIVYFTMLLLVGKLSENWPVYLVLFGMLIGYAITSNWFFAGMEKFKYLMFFFIPCYSFYTICLLLFVHGTGDVFLVAFLETLYIAMIGVLNIVFITKKFGISIKIPSIESIKKQVKDAMPMFITGVMFYMYTNSVGVFLDVLSNDADYGYYAAAAVIITAAQGLIGAITTVIFPRASSLVKESNEKAIMFIRKCLVFLLGLGVLVGVGIYFCSDFLHVFKFQQTITVLKIQSILPLILVINNTLGFQIMLSLNYRKAFALVYAAAFALYIPLTFILVPTFTYIGTSFIVVIIESFIAIIEFIYLYKKGINIFSGLIKWNC